MGKLSYNDKLCMQTLWQVSQSHCLVYAERLSHCGDSTKDFLTSAQLPPFVRVSLEMMAFSPSPCSRSFCIQYSKLHTVKTMGTHGKINAIWWNFKINVQKLADICGYELPTKLQNFTQKKLNRSENIPQVLGGGLLFWNTLYITNCISRVYSIWPHFQKRSI